MSEYVWYKFGGINSNEEVEEGKKILPTIAIIKEVIWSNNILEIYYKNVGDPQLYKSKYNTQERGIGGTFGWYNTEMIRNNFNSIADIIFMNIIDQMGNVPNNFKNYLETNGLEESLKHLETKTKTKTTTNN